MATPTRLNHFDPNLRARDAVWEAIRRLRTFSLRELVTAARVNYAQARGYLVALTLSGYLHRTGETRMRARGNSNPAPEYSLVRDTGTAAPRLTLKGVPPRYGAARGNLWRSIKILRDFDHIDLAIVASTTEVRVSREYASDYIWHLRRAGYLQLTKAMYCGSKARPPSAARHRLIPQRWTGPLPPRVKRSLKAMYDPNLDQLITAASWGALK